MYTALEHILFIIIIIILFIYSAQNYSISMHFNPHIYVDFKLYKISAAMVQCPCSDVSFGFMHLCSFFSESRPNCYICNESIFRIHTQKVYRINYIIPLYASLARANATLLS